MANNNSSVLSRKLKSIPFYILMLIAVLFTFWPILITALEGADADIGPFFSGQGITFIGGDTLL